MANELYSILGIECTAAEQDVKRAYFRQVKEHSPENDPEQFKLIRSAYETLYDAAARRDYDTLQQYGGEIQALSEEAEEAMELEDWDEAIRLYKRILVLDANSGAARSGLGMCQLQGDYAAEAVKTFTKLVGQNPESVAYLMHLAYAHYAVAEDAGENTPLWCTSLTSAQETFVRVVEIEPLNSDAHQGVAAVRREVGDWKGSAEWLESAVSADGQTDLHDFDALISLVVAYVVGEDPRKLKATMERLVAVAPEDQDAKEYMAARLAQLGAQMYEAGRFTESAMAFEHAAKLDPADANIRKAAKHAATLGRADKEWERLKDDSYVVPPLRGIALVPLATAHDEDVSDYQVQRMFQALDSYRPHQIADSLARLKSTYPAIYSLREDVYREMSQAVGPARSTGSAYSGSGSSSQSSSGCFVATAAYGSPLSAELDRLRTFRDDILLNTDLGRLFVKGYYSWGPLFADLIRPRPTLRWTMRVVLGAVIRLLPRTDSRQDR